MKKLSRLLIACAGLSISLAWGYSNPVEGGTTETVTNQWNVSVPWLMVGSNTKDNSLIISQSGQVNNLVGYVGNNAGSSRNQVLVSGAGASWSNATELSVGNLGAQNRLSISGGGQVYAEKGYLGNHSNSNQVRVADSGSVFTAPTLHVGHQGGVNDLSILNGGKVKTVDGTIGYWLGADYNAVTVKGSDSIWHNTGTLNVGNYGSGNILAVNPKALVESPVVNLGVESSSSNNTLSVVGQGALLNTPTIYIGGSSAGAGGAGNKIYVSDGGTVATSDLNIFAGNTFNLNNGGTLSINTNFNAAMPGFNFNSGGTLEIGGKLTGMNSEIESQKTLTLKGHKAMWFQTYNHIKVGNFSSNNTLKIVNGGSVHNKWGSIGSTTGSDSNLVEVSGYGSRWAGQDYLIIGHEGSHNTLLVSNGGSVNYKMSYIGEMVGSTGNHVTIKGEKSVWRNQTYLEVGFQGNNNHLNIENGGVVYADATMVGDKETSFGNSVIISGKGSALISHSALQVGSRGTSNLLEVVKGGKVVNQSAWIGAFGEANHNYATVSGENSEWDVMDLVVGHAGAFNRLNVLDGGLVTGSNLFVGAFANNNAVIVSGAGSMIDNSNDSFVGFEGEHNSLVIKNGGQIFSRNGFIGAKVGANSNTVRVTGTDTFWHLSDTFLVGGENDGTNWINGGTGNLLTVEHGGWVFVGDVNTNNLYAIGNVGGIAIGDTTGTPEMILANQSTVNSGYGFIGLSAGETGSGLVSGSKTVWNNSRDLYVGFAGSGNSLTIKDGGRVNSRYGYIGSKSGADNNIVNVIGKNSVWNNTGHLLIGNAGSGNRIIVSNGASIKNSAGYVGYSSNSSNNIATISGSNSIWHTAGRITVGYQGDNNKLVIENGGQVQSDDIIVSDNSVSTGNQLILSGKDSKLTTTGGGGVVVGAGGSNNRIEVTDEAILNVSGGEGYAILGYHAGANNNSMLLDNATVQLKQNMYVGLYGADNHMVITNGGIMHTVGGTVIGRHETSDRNHAIVTGIGSLLKSTTLISVGSKGSDNHLTIENGGRIENRIGAIGFSQGANSNSVLVTGNDSVWQNNEALYLGGHKDGTNWINGGTANLLTVEHGGWVFVGDVNTNNLYAIGNVGGIAIGDTTGTPEMILANQSTVNSGYGFIGLSAGETGSVTVSGSNSIWKNSGRLTVGKAGTKNQLSILNGGRVDSVGGVIGFEASASDNTTLVSGAGSVWNAKLSDPTDSGFNQNPPIEASSVQIDYPEHIWEPRRIENPVGLFIGKNSSGNCLDILDGALVKADSTYIGYNTGADSNRVSVIGTDSKWQVSNLIIGGGESVVTPQGGEFYEVSPIPGGRGNSLVVANSGLVNVEHNLKNQNYSTINLDSSSRITIGGNYYQDATSILRFGVETNAVGAPLNPFVSVGGTAEFETGATLQYHSNVGVLDFDTFYTNLIVEADQLIVGGVTNANALDLEAINLDGSLVDVLLWEENQNIYGLVGRKYLADSAGFTPGSTMARLAKDIDDLSLMGNANAAAQINTLNGMSSVQQRAQLTQRYTQGTPIYRHRQGMLGGQKQVLLQGQKFQEEKHDDMPEGAAGPHAADQGLRGWVRGYGSWADHDGTTQFSGFDQNVYGTVVGFDKTFGNVLMGAAGGYSRSDLTQDNADASDAQTGFGVLYASFGSTDWFGDFNVGYGRSRIKMSSGTALGGDSNTDANLYSVYFGGGKEIPLAEGKFLLTPEGALNISLYDQNGYQDGLMSVDAYDWWSYQSRLGAAFAWRKTTDSMVIKPEIRAYWLHEFNADTDRLGYTLGGGHYTFGVQSPDQDIFELGTGISTLINDRLEFILDLDSQFSENYKSLTLGLRALYEF